MTALLESAAAALSLLRPEIEDALGRVPGGESTAPRLLETAAALRVSGFEAAAAQLAALAEGGSPAEVRARWCALSAWLADIADAADAAPADFSGLYLARVRIGNQAAAAPALTACEALRAARAVYEQGLLEWLRGEAAGLVRMGEALATLRAMPDAGEPLWWGAAELVQRLRAEAATQDDKILLGQLGRAMGRVAAPDVAAVTALRTLQRTLLDRLAPGVPLMDADCAQAVTAAAQRWRSLASPQRAGATEGAALAADARVLRAHWREAGAPELAELWSAIVELGESPQLTHELAGALTIEMECAFSVSSAAARGTVTAPAEIASLAERIRLAAQNRAPGNTLAESWALRISAREQRLRERRLLADMGREINADLQYIEQQVDGMTRASGALPDRAACRQHLTRVAGGFELLHLEAAAGLTRAAAGLLDELGDETVALAGDFAEIICALQFYLQRVLRGDAAAEAVLYAADPRGARAVQPEAGTPGGEQAPALQAAPAAFQPFQAFESAPPVDAPSLAEDILEIYLEEAETLLADMARHLAAALDETALQALQRSFHTLKGSSRVAGQPALGDAAACYEQALERIHYHYAQPQDAGVHALLSQGHQSISGWVAELRAGMVPHIDVDAVAAAVAVAGAAAADETAWAPTPEVAPPAALTLTPALPYLPETTSLAPPPPALVPALAYSAHSDTRSLSAELGRLFLGEALQYVQQLQAAAAACGSGGAADAEAIRAAHTLSGIARAVKLPPLSALAAETEHWLEMHAAAAPDAPAAALLARAVDALEAMVAAVRRDEVLLSADGLTAELRMAVERERRRRQAAAAGAQLDAEIDPDLMRIFANEALEIEAELARAFERWRAEPQDYTPVQAIARALHTLKGGARAAGALTLGEVIHGVETQLSRWLHDGAAEESAHDSVIASIQDTLDNWYAELDAYGVAEGAGQPGVAPAPAAGAAPVVADAPPEAWLRVNAASLDRMLRSVGEAAITRSATENDVTLLRQSLQDLSESAERLRRQVREIEMEAEKQVQARAGEFARADFDPLEFDRYTRLHELSRLIAESINDVTSLQHNNMRMVADAADSLEREARLGRELRGELTRVRAVTFADAVPRLQRVTRQAARALGREALLTVSGEQVEFDKSVLERLLPPIEHMLRNALAHGIEDTATRAAAGKPEAGDIGIAIRQDVDGFTITLSDDGRGLDAGAIRARGAALGLIAEDAQPDARALAELIFTPAFSTSREVTEVAGRGIGLDVVRSAVNALGGSIAVHSEPGRGTTFDIQVPLTVLLVNALLVRAAGAVYAIPAPLVTTVRSPQDAEWARLDAAGGDTWMGRGFPRAELAALLGAAEPTVRRAGKLLLLDDGARRLALGVDEILGRQELGVKETGPQLRHAPGVKGASILGDDQTVLIINPLLLESPDVRGAAPAAPRSEVPAARTVMVVDDSVTVRKITGRLMTRAGYRVVLAKDGIEALELLDSAKPDAMLLDIEMPRMDGFEVTRRVRADAVYAALPILVITSRMAQKHREYALSLGVTRYIGKPYDEDALLREIETCMAEAAADPARGTAMAEAV